MAPRPPSAAGRSPSRRRPRSPARRRGWPGWRRAGCRPRPRRARWPGTGRCSAGRGRRAGPRTGTGSAAPGRDPHRGQHGGDVFAGEVGRGEHRRPELTVRPAGTGGTVANTRGRPRLVLGQDRAQPGPLVGLGGRMVELEERHARRAEPQRPVVVARAKHHDLADPAEIAADHLAVEEPGPGLPAGPACRSAPPSASQRRAALRPGSPAGCAAGRTRPWSPPPPGWSWTRSRRGRPLPPRAEHPLAGGHDRGAELGDVQPPSLRRRPAACARPAPGRSAVPRFGTGVRNGASVSTRIRSAGATAAASRRLAALGNVTLPGEAHHVAGVGAPLRHLRVAGEAMEDDMWRVGLVEPECRARHRARRDRGSSAPCPPPWRSRCGRGTSRAAAPAARCPGSSPARSRRPRAPRAAPPAWRSRRATASRPPGPACALAVSFGWIATAA